MKKILDLLLLVEVILQVRMMNILLMKFQLFMISLFKEHDGKPILDESYRLEVPLNSESYSAFEFTYNIDWNIELA